MLIRKAKSEGLSLGSQTFFNIRIVRRELQIFLNWLQILVLQPESGIGSVHGKDR